MECGWCLRTIERKDIEQWVDYQPVCGKCYNQERRGDYPII